MTGLELLKALPGREDIVATIPSIAGWRAPLDRRGVLQTIKRLNRLVADVGKLEIKGSPSVDREQGERNHETLVMYLETARTTHGVLESATARALEREVTGRFRDLGPEFIRARSAALESLRELRALLAFLLGAEDDLTLGVDIIPALPPIGPSRPSVPLDL